MGILADLKQLAIQHLAKTHLPDTMARDMMAEDIAGRVIRRGEVLSFDRDGVERFARSCIDEVIDDLKRRVDRERQ